MRKYYTVFDYGGKQVGFAPAKKAGGVQQVQEEVYI